jgi:hypothetical protein
MADALDIPELSYNQPIPYLFFKHIINDAFEGKNPFTELDLREDIYNFVQHSKAMVIMKLVIVDVLKTDDKLIQSYLDQINEKDEHHHKLTHRVNSIIDRACDHDMIKTLNIEPKKIIEYFSLDCKFRENWVQDGIAIVLADKAQVLDETGSMQYYLSVDQEQVDGYFPRYVVWFFENVGNKRLIQLALAEGDRDDIVKLFSSHCLDGMLNNNTPGVIIRKIILHLKVHCHRDTKE